jgi:hypothetical protein
VGVKIRVCSDLSVDLALLTDLVLPTHGGDGDFQGEEAVVVAPALAISHDFGGPRLAFNAGYRVREESAFLDLPIGSEIFYRLGLGYRFPPSGSQLGLELDAAISGATIADQAFASSELSPLELLVGGQAGVWGTVQVFGGAGLGLAGCNSDIRLFAGSASPLRSRRRPGR